VSVTNVLSLGLSVLALGFAAYSFLRQFKLQRRLTEIEEGRRQDEVTRRLEADVTASFEQYTTSQGRNGYRFVLVNQGLARATEVLFEIREPSRGNAPRLLSEGHHFPLALDPGQRYTIVASVAMQTAPSVDVDVSWTDGTGAKVKRLNLSVSP
jgi:hypothetical protein